MAVIDKAAIIKRAHELETDILLHGLTIRVGNELESNPSAEELDRLVSEYGLILDTGAIRFSENASVTA